MGYRPERTLYELVFEDTDLEGLSITVRASSMKTRLHAFYDLDWTPEDDAAARRAKQDELFRLFIEHVVEWNLEDDNGPVPVTLDGLLGACEPNQVGVIVGVWQAGRQRVPVPLEPESPGIELSEIPMTVLPSTPAHVA